MIDVISIVAWLIALVPLNIFMFYPVTAERDLRMQRLLLWPTVILDIMFLIDLILVVGRY